MKMADTLHEDPRTFKIGLSNGDSFLWSTSEGWENSWSKNNSGDRLFSLRYEVRPKKQLTIWT